MKKILFATMVTILLAGCSSSQQKRDMDHPEATMHHEHGEHADMTMGDMVDMLKGKTGDELDAAFLEGMIPHHQGAVDMAELILENAKHEELRAMARDIIDAQQREIDMMKGWQKEWGYAK